MPEVWTFESLAAVDTATLERVLLAGTAPDPAHLNDYVYHGWNHEPLAALTGRKFKKGFFQRDGRNLGYNLAVVQDNQGYRGEWRAPPGDGQPFGYYLDVALAQEPIQPFARDYPRAGMLNYDIELNRWRDLPLRLLRDVVVLPNVGDHELVLGKAYAYLFPWLNIFVSYFILGHRERAAVR
ncbi:MAG: hypothetical protein ACJ8CR_26480 [Roseiflexaceae bacterium]